MPIPVFSCKELQVNGLCKTLNNKFKIGSFFKQMMTEILKLIIKELKKTNSGV